MERMAEVVPEADWQSLQHFLSQSSWAWKPVFQRVAEAMNELLGGTVESCLILDETGIPKKGTKSVGVARQYCGALGKVDSCQVGVFAGLAKGSAVGLVNARLYLPNEWVKSSKRCRLAGVPEEEQTLRTKPELALEMVRELRSWGVGFHWIAADSVYGQDPALLRGLEDRGEMFVVDVNKSQPVYLDDPGPSPATSQGRSKAAKLVAGAPKQTLESWACAQPEDAWQRIWIRHTTKGRLYLEALHRRVWLWDGREERARCWHALVTREVDQPGVIKYALSNAPVSTPVARLAQMQRQRFWIERAFQDAKQDAGLDEYQARGWKAWHHHMALVMMAMLFILQERQKHGQTHPLMSSTDIKILLTQVLPRRDITTEEVVRQMEIRHRQRQASIDAAYARKGPPGGLLAGNG